MFEAEVINFNESYFPRIRNTVLNHRFINKRDLTNREEINFSFPFNLTNYFY